MTVSYFLQKVKIIEVIIIEDKYIGEIYGCYEIISRSNQRAKDGHIYYNCKCIHCGVEKEIQLSSIKYRNDNSCTHLIHIGDITIPNDVYNKSIPDRRLRNIFLKMIRRCYDSNDKEYYLYGENGVDIYEEWINNPSNFYQWSLSNGYKKDLSIDRINEQKGYYPNNCRWIPFSDNARFKSNTNYITATVTLSGRQWASLIPEHGKNWINSMIREQGKDKTIEYIEKRFMDKHNLINNK